MLTAADFQQAIDQRIVDFPEIAARYYAGDPVISQNRDAMIVMFSMLSGQIEVATAEPFEKVRDATVLADAALKGILRTGTPVTVSIAAFNRGADAAHIAQGTWLLDTNGRTYCVDAPAVIPPGETNRITAVQVTKPRVITHTVKRSSPFYRVQIPDFEKGTFLNSIAVQDSGGEFLYSGKFTNVRPGERIFHVETDEFQQTHIVFGYKNEHGPVVGHQPESGDVLTITLTGTAGEVAPPDNSQFSFQYTTSPQLRVVDLTLKSIINQGANPVDIVGLRDLCRFPSVYDDNAVYLGEFDFMIRKRMQKVRFLAIWNEGIEEYIRGPDVRNMNTLFVAIVYAKDGPGCEQFMVDDGTEALSFISEPDLTESQINIRQLIGNADDSYRVKFVRPKRKTLGINISAYVPATYDESTVSRKIKDSLLSEFGLDAAFTRYGAAIPNAQRVSELLKGAVAALQSPESDFGVHLSVPEFVAPEHWLYADNNSISVSVTKTNQTVPDFKSIAL